jgi:hypothetical protein
MSEDEVEDSDVSLDVFELMFSPVAKDLSTNLAL